MHRRRWTSRTDPLDTPTTHTIRCTSLCCTTATESMSMQLPSMPSSVAASTYAGARQRTMTDTDAATATAAPVAGAWATLCGDGICLSCPNLPTTLFTDVSAI